VYFCLHATGTSCLLTWHAAWSYCSRICKHKNVPWKSHERKHNENTKKKHVHAQGFKIIALFKLLSRSLFLRFKVCVSSALRISFVFIRFYSAGFESRARRKFTSRATETFGMNMNEILGKSYDAINHALMCFDPFDTAQPKIKLFPFR